MTDQNPPFALRLWLASHWVAGAGFMAGALIAFAPLLAATVSLPLLLIFLHSPVYMVHQLEEHTGDRFRAFVNRRIFGGRDALTVTDVLVINLPLVWGLNLAALYAAFLWGPGFGLVAPYAMLVNALAHLGGAARLKAYNPGLVTAIIMFLPLSLVTLWLIGGLPGVTTGQHLAALALALLLHVMIILVVLWRLRMAHR
jgi:hypothetical protein